MKEKTSSPAYSYAWELPFPPQETAETLSEEKKMDPASPVSDRNERKLPEEILLLRFGNNAFTKGTQEGEFPFAPEDADAVIREFSRRKKDLVIDFEHQSVQCAKAPAAGWIKKLVRTEEGLLALVKYWTKEAEELILNGKYRYFSPALYFSPDGTKVVSLHSVALTNHPALHGIPALAADDLAGEVPQEAPEELPAVPAEEAAAAEQPAAVEKEEADGTVPALLADLRKKEAQWDTLLKRHACTSFADVEKRLDEARSVVLADKVREALEKGKLTEHMRSWAEALAGTAPELFDAYVRSVPRLVPDNAFTEQALFPPAEHVSDPEEEEIFSMLGLSPAGKKSGKNL